MSGQKWSYIHTYIHTNDIFKAPFNQKDTKRIKEKERGGKIKRVEKKRNNQLIGEKVSLKRLFERGHGRDASGCGRQTVPKSRGRG